MEGGDEEDLFSTKAKIIKKTLYDSISRSLVSVQTLSHVQLSRSSVQFNSI